ncbi:MAG TPA: sulfatase-like hydrolase/transferase [Nocardioidaceae bacterium]|nr:sulfatase-like hydrolase/transferase [Nocardioidaceae bacterium]
MSGDTATSSVWKRATLIVGLRLGYTFLLAVGANLALDVLQVRADGGNLWNDRADHSVALFLLGSVAVWLVILLVQSVVGSLAVTTVLAVVITAVTGLANFEKIRLRREPLYPGDLEFAGDPGFLEDMVGARIIVLFVVGVALVAVVCFIGYRLGRRRMPRIDRSAHPRAWRGMVALRVLTALACVVSLAYLTDFNEPGNGARRSYDALGAFWKPWNQRSNYVRNGFVGGFLYNMHVEAMKRPADYSAAEMDRIAAKYSAVAARVNKGRDAHALDDVNVVAVLGESFSDPTRIDGLTVEHDPIPFTRGLMKRTTSGQMLAELFGGGTANMEFELLTGMSMGELAPQASIAYQMLVPNYAHFPSAVGYFKAHGHEAVAIHPFQTKMYRRREVYDTFGFDRFVYDQTMTFHNRIGHHNYISDRAAYDELLWQIESADKPLFVNLITMQNHLPYSGKYDDPATVTGPGGARLGQMGQYVRGLTYSDQAMKYLIEQLQASKEKTVLVFYGDHLSSAYPQSLFRRNGERVMHETPFFVWSNFSSGDQQLPTTSPSHFVPLLLQRAGATIPPYYALLDELQAEIPALDSGMFIDAEDRTVRRSDLSAKAKQLLHDYRLVQYDLSVGKRYSQDAMFYPRGAAAAPAADD